MVPPAMLVPSRWIEVTTDDLGTFTIPDVPVSALNGGAVINVAVSGEAILREIVGPVAVNGGLSDLGDLRTPDRGR